MKSCLCNSCSRLPTKSEHKLLGSIDTPEKFNAKRAQLAQNEWKRMKANDSKECRNCHRYDYMDFTEQGDRAAKKHPQAFADGMTCIDCHKGIPHQLPSTDQHIGKQNEGAVEISHGEKPEAKSEENK